MCSTPFGITDYIGPGTRSRGQISDVFNAFRHHGLYRPHPSMRLCGLSVSVQRLSASRIISAGCRSCSRRSTAAGVQRLSASRIISVGVAGAVPALRARRVFNAFRHHGLYRCRRRPRRAAWSGVQRLSASRIISAQPVAARAILAAVFNAFRHHGLYRRVPPELLDDLRLVFNAFRHHGLYRRSASSARATPTMGVQRLSASRIISA